MKKYIVVGLLIASFILSPVFVSAQTSQQDQIATLIHLLQSLVQLLQQQLLMIQKQIPSNSLTSPSQYNQSTDWQRIFLPSGATVRQQLELDLDGDLLNDLAVVYSISNNTGVMIDSYGWLVLRRSSNNSWQILYDNKPSNSTNDVRLQIIRKENLQNPGLLVNSDFHGANTSSNWVIAFVPRDGISLKSLNSLSVIDSTPIRKEALAKFGDIDEWRSRAQVVGKTIEELVPGYSSQTGRCCSDKPSVLIRYNFDGNSLTVISATEQQ